ncbi:MAG: hypothetical protein PWQ82_1183 [Thermosediminibacterales bacterium]|nr:hypothetical protein [Thermosediminibacterales bacterium]
MASYEVTGSVNPDKLIAGHEIPLLTTGVLLASGQGVLERGSVIEIVTADGKGKLCDSAAADGSQVAKYILAEDVDTTGGDVMAVCYKSGVFNRNALIFGGTDTADVHEDELRDVNIYLKDEISY